MQSCHAVIKTTPSRLRRKFPTEFTRFVTLDLCMTTDAQPLIFGSGSTVREFIQLIGTVEQNPLEKTTCPAASRASGSRVSNRARILKSDTSRSILSNYIMKYLESLAEEKMIFDSSTISIWISSLRNAVIVNGQTLTVEYQTLPGQDLGKLGAFIAVTGPGGTGPILGQTPLTGISDGKFHKVTVKVPTGNLQQESYLVGLYMKANDLTSMAASVNLAQGLIVNYQPTTLSVFNATNSSVNAFYTVPSYVQPRNRLDWIYIFNGGVPVSDPNQAITHAVVPTNASQGAVNITGLSLQSGQTYIVQYNPGVSTQPMVAGFAFEVF